MPRVFRPIFPLHCRATAARCPTFPSVRRRARCRAARLCIAGERGGALGEGGFLSRSHPRHCLCASPQRGGVSFPFSSLNSPLPSATPAPPALPHPTHLFFPKRLVQRLRDAVEAQGSKTEFLLAYSATTREHAAWARRGVSHSQAHLDNLG